MLGRAHVEPHIPDVTRCQAYREGDEKKRGELSWAPGPSAMAGLAQQVLRRWFTLQEAGEVVEERGAPRRLCLPRAQHLRAEERQQG